MKDLLQQLIASERVVALETDNSSILASLQEKTGLIFPPLFRELLKGYAFEPFVLGDIEFFGTIESEDGDLIADAIFRDEILSAALLEAKLLQVGRPDSGSYDPVCFNLASRSEEPELVQVDHESVLSFSKLRISKVLAPSFPELIAASLA